MSQLNVPVIILGVIFIADAVCAQDNHIHKDLVGNHPISIISLGENGIILKSESKSLSHKNDGNLVYHSANGEIIWDEKLEPTNNKNVSRTLVSSPTGNVVYNIEIKGKAWGDFFGSTHYIHQIRKDGQEQKFELQGKKEFGMSLQTVFCDDDYLYYLTTQNGHEENDKKKHKDKLILNRFSNDALQYQRFVLDLPAIPEGENSTLWAYMGQKGGNFYLISKSTATGLGRNTFELVSINNEGKIVDKKSFIIQLDKKFTRPAWNIGDQNANYARLTDLDFFWYTSTTNPTSTIMSWTETSFVVTAGSFGYLQFDPIGNSFYAFGLFGPAPFRKLGPAYEGFYIIKYDMEGREVWRLQQSCSEEILEDKLFRIHATPREREIRLKVLPNGKMNFSIHLRKKLFDYCISAEGKLLGTKNEDEMPELSAGHVFVDEKLKSVEFREAGKKYSDYFIGFFNSGELLFQNVGEAYDLYYFKK